MKDIKRIINIIEKITSKTSHSLKHGKDFVIVEKLEDAKEFEKKNFGFCYCFKDKIENCWLKVGQATYLQRINNHFGIFPSRGTQSSTLSLSLLYDTRMTSRLIEDGVNVDIYNRSFQQEDLTTSVKCDKWYVTMGGHKTFKEWIEENCEKYIICLKPIDNIQTKIVQNMIEGILQFELNPKYEGPSSHNNN